MGTTRSQTAGVPVCTAVVRLPLTEGEAMSTLVVVLLVLFVLGGGGWGYSRWRG